MKLLLLLIMGVELVNNCVVFPHQINWREWPKWSRVWHTEIAGGVTGGEDRSTGCTAADRALEFQLTTFSIQERSRLNARLLAARKSGRACCPYWGRGQRIAEAAAQPWELSLGNAAVVTGLIPGEIYWWEKGPWDIDLVNMNGDVLTASGYFAARLDSVIINMTNALTPGPVTRVLGQSAVTEGLWPWAAGQHAFFIRPFRAAPPNVSFENRDVQINCGNVESAPHPWLPDVLGAGGDVYAPAPPSAVDVSRVHGWDAPPQAVLQSGRYISTQSPALAAAWSPALLGWRVDLVPGQLYFYTAGPQDGPGLATLSSSAPGGVLNLAASGTFTAEYPWAVIYAPETETPGTVQPGSQIVYTVSGLITGVECSVRLHFAELEAGFDGSTARRQFTATVRGERSLTRAGIEPWAFAGETMNAATTVDFVVTPDPAGRITITLTPEAPDWCAGINGIEVFQRTWEVAELAAGTTDNLIKWTTPLKGVYAAGSLVFPVFFGQVKTTEAVALTGRHAEMRFKIEEPIGEGVLGVNACPAEVCIPDDLLTPPDLRLPEYPGQALPGAAYFSPAVGVDFGPGDPAVYTIQLDITGDSEDPADSCLPGVLEAWAAKVWELFEVFKEENEIVTTEEQLFWYYTNHDGFLSYNPNFIWGMDPPVWVKGDYLIGLEVQYLV